MNLINNRKTFGVSSVNKKNISSRQKTKNSCMTKRQLIEFEMKIAKYFVKAKIKTPVHLVGGNEVKLIRIFGNVNKGDWILSTYRSHYHYLLATGGEDRLEKMILDGHSMHIFNHAIPFFTSSIVAGAVPIALGVALALKLKNSNKKVWCFVGDMAAETGLFHECAKYASRQELPITYVVEDNGMSVRTPTQDVWGKGKSKVVKRYKYTRTFPHQGTGTKVVF